MNIEEERRQFTKVLLEVEREKGEPDVESVWVTPTEKGYSLDNIPFYARGLALGDVVSAVQASDGMLRCTGLVTASGHSTVRLWFADPSDVQAIRDTLREKGCASEMDLPRLVAVDIPPVVSYSSIRDFLEEKEHAGLLEYEEACLGQ